MATATGSGAGAVRAETSPTENAARRRALRVAVFMTSQSGSPPGSSPEGSQWPILESGSTESGFHLAQRHHFDVDPTNRGRPGLFSLGNDQPVGAARLPSSKRGQIRGVEGLL